MSELDAFSIALISYALGVISSLATQIVKINWRQSTRIFVLERKVEDIERKLERDHGFVRRSHSRSSPSS